MPSFDIVSKVDLHEVSNAVDQANREVNNRFDFKGSNAHFELTNEQITLIAPNDFQLKQMVDILHTKFAKRSLDIKALDHKDPEESSHEARQQIMIRQGIDTDIGKSINKFIKGQKIKVQSSIQGDQVRVNGKKRDDLQAIIALLRKVDFGLPLQFENFRD